MRVLASLSAILLAVAPVGSSAQFATISAPSNGNSIPNFTNNGGLPKWKACLAKVKAGTGSCTILVGGESTPAGNGCAYQSPNSNYSRACSWPSQIAALLAQAGIASSANAVMGNAGATGGTTFTSYQAYDPRLTLNSWVINTTQPLIGQGAFQSKTTGSGVLTFNPTNGTAFPSATAIQTDTLDVYWLAYASGSGDVASINVNGGASLGTLVDNGGTGTGLLKKTFSTTLGTNSWGFTNTTNGFDGSYVQGLIAYNSAIPQVKVVNGGWGGAKITNWSNTSLGFGGPIAMIQLMAPDLCIWQDMGNDLLVTSIPNYITAYEAVITACQASGDFLVVNSQPASPTVLSFTASTATNVLTVTGSVTGGNLIVGHTINGAGIPAGTTIASLGTGTGQAGTYNLSATVGTIGSESMTAGSSYATQQTYAAAGQTIATAMNVPILDWWQYLCGWNGSVCTKGGWTANMQAGWNGNCCTAAADVAHNGGVLYGIEATYISQILMQ